MRGHPCGALVTGVQTFALPMYSLPPIGVDELEDWIRVPASESDVQARVEGLRRRLSAQVQPAPDIDEDGVLRVGDRWVSLPPVEARLTAALLDRYGAVEIGRAHV